MSEHRLEGEWVEFLASPNRSPRPDPEGVDLIVLHSISLPEGNYGGPDIVSLFLNQLDTGLHQEYHDLAGLRVSSHFLIRRHGEVIQFVLVSEAAWHAGESAFAGRQGCNDFSIGIEFEGAVGKEFTAAQLESGVSLVSLLMSAYPRITRKRLVRHSDIAPGRKFDPGKTFPYSDFVERCVTAA